MQMEGMFYFPRGDLLLDGREYFLHSFNFDFTNRGWSDPRLSLYTGINRRAGLVGEKYFASSTSGRFPLRGVLFMRTGTAL